MAQKLKKGRTICITSSKGGVGKTTTTINLAGIYETMEKKVLLIDLDLTNGGIALCLNRTYKKSIYTLFEDTNLNTYEKFNDYVTKYDEFIDILPCPIDPRQATKINPCLIDIIIERASFIYDVILIDTTHVLNEINLYTMDKADMILYLVTNDPVNLKNMKSIVSIFKSLNIKNYKVLLNNSVNPFKGYFSLYDIKSIVSTNIDYSLSDKFFAPDIDKFVMAGKIITLDKKSPKIYAKDYPALMNIAADLLIGGKENE